jgi:hypothetical protein
MSMTESDLEFRVSHRGGFADFLSVWIRTRWSRPPMMMIADPLIIKEIKQGEFCEPCFNLTKDAAINLMDELWQRGVRPTAEIRDKEAIELVKAHLADMRIIVWNRLNIKP